MTTGAGPGPGGVVVALAGARSWSAAPSRTPSAAARTPSPCSWWRWSRTRCRRRSPARRSGPAVGVRVRPADREPAAALRAHRPGARRAPVAPVDRGAVLRGCPVRVGVGERRDPAGSSALPRRGRERRSRSPVKRRVGDRGGERETRATSASRCTSRVTFSGPGVGAARRVEVATPAIDPRVAAAPGHAGRGSTSTPAVAPGRAARPASSRPGPDRRGRPQDAPVKAAPSTALTSAASATPARASTTTSATPMDTTSQPRRTPSGRPAVAS